MKNYCSIGKLVATFGYKGEMILQHQLGKKTSLKGLENFFIEESRDEMLPYFLEYTRIKSANEIYVKIEGIDSMEAARKLLQKQVWLPEAEFHQYTLKSAPISMLGFHVVDNGNDLGEILEVIEQPHQLLCRLEIQGKEVLIPVHQDTLVKIDKKKKMVIVNLPDGLLEVFI